MSRYLGSSLRLNIRQYCSRAKQEQDKYVARLMPKRIWKASEQTPNFESEEKIKVISEAVQKYLANYKQNMDFMEQRNQEFELGKRHLANMMGYDPDQITQEQINKAIEYLFPSGLFQRHFSRPVMYPPEVIYQKFKSAQYSKSGRPFSSFFYTGLPHYYESLYQLHENYEELNAYEDEKIALGQLAHPEDKFDIRQFKIMTKAQLEDLFIEDLKDSHYERFVNHLTRLIEHPYSAMKSDFIQKFTIIKEQQRAIKQNQIELQVDKQTGREFSEATGRRKLLTRVLVRVYANGSGVFWINDKYTLNHFSYYVYREQIISPLVLTGLLNKVDIYVYTKESESGLYETKDEPLKLGWDSSYAGAIRHGISLALLAHVDDDMKENLRINGLLQCDYRRKERKKPGKYKARKSRPYRKR